jgi:acetyl esterase/lipase
LTPSVSGRYQTGGALTKAQMEWFADQYVPDVSSRRDPYISPLYADLRGLPAVLLTVGTQDPLLDDSVLLHMRLRSDGVESQLCIYPGGGHGFEAGPTGIAAAAKGSVATFLLDAIR